jgi:hypothetical protein
LKTVEYNGFRGSVLSGPNEKERYIVDVVLKEAPRETKEMSLKPDNLLVVKEVTEKGGVANDNWRAPVYKSKYFSKAKPMAPPPPPKTAKSWMAEMEEETVGAAAGASPGSPRGATHTTIHVKPATTNGLEKTYRKKEEKEKTDTSPRAPPPAAS